MPTIKGLEKLERSERISQFIQLIRIELKAASDGGAIELHLANFLPREKPSSIIKLRFSGVINLSLQGLDTISPNIQGLEFKDISANGWDRLNWEVNDQEEGKLNFLCRDVEIVSLQRNMTETVGEI